MSNIFPFIVGAPAYFAGTMQLGGLMQTASAFGSVQGALSYFVSSSVYRTLAEWIAVVDRLDGFQHAVEAGRAAAVAPPVVKVEPTADARAVELADVEVTLPNGGRSLVGADARRAAEGRDACCSTGRPARASRRCSAPSPASGRSARARVTVPKDARVMMLPQRPYFPVGTLAAAIAYPAEPTAYSREQLTETLEAVGLPALAPRLDEEAHWNRMLSLGEQQRLGIARAVLEKPDYLFLDEATASLDEPSEAKLYRLLAGAAAQRRGHLDRPPLDARGVPPQALHAGARRKALSRARGRDRARGRVALSPPPCGPPRGWAGSALGEPTTSMIDVAKGIATSGFCIRS